MSLAYRNQDGTETPVAGLNGLSGELVPSVSYYQKGTWAVGTLPANGTANTFITLATPMPDADYVIVPTVTTGHGIISVGKQTATEFQLVLVNDLDMSLDYTVTWRAFKLMTDADRALDEQAIADNAEAIAAINAKIPSGASASNQLVTGNDVYKKTRFTVANNKQRTITFSGSSGDVAALLYFEGSSGATIGQASISAYNQITGGRYRGLYTKGFSTTTFVDAVENGIVVGTTSPNGVVVNAIILGSREFTVGDEASNTVTSWGQFMSAIASDAVVSPTPINITTEAQLIAIREKVGTAYPPKMVQIYNAQSTAITSSDGSLVLPEYFRGTAYVNNEQLYIIGQRLGDTYMYYYYGSNPTWVGGKLLTTNSGGSLHLTQPAGTRRYYFDADMTQATIIWKRNSTWGMACIDRFSPTVGIIASTSDNDNNKPVLTWDSLSSPTTDPYRGSLIFENRMSISMELTIICAPGMYLRSESVSS